MIILGLSSLSDDTTACLMVDGQMVAMASEAQLSGAWSEGRFPYQAVATVLRLAHVEAFDVNRVAVARVGPPEPTGHLHRQFFADWNFTSSAWRVRRPKATPSQLDVLLQTARETSANERRMLSAIVEGAPAATQGWRWALNRAAASGWLDDFAPAIGWTKRLRERRQSPAICAERLVAGLCEFGWGDKLSYVAAPLAVTVSAFRQSGFARALVVSFDGDDAPTSATLSIHDEHGPRRLDALDKVTFSWRQIAIELADALGCRWHDRAQWLAELAPCGDAAILAEVFRACVHWDGHLPAWKWGATATLPWRLAGGFAPADIAAAWQRVFFETIERWLAFHVARTGLHHVVIGGDIPGRAELGQHLRQTLVNTQVFADSRSLAAAECSGAALLKHGGSGRSGPEPTPLSASSRFTSRDLQNALTSANLGARWSDDIETDIARLLSEGCIVARYAQASGGPTVIASAENLRSRSRMLQQLGRPSFFPLDVAILAEELAGNFANASLPNIAESGATLLQSGDRFCQQYPAAINANGAVAPRIVSLDTDPGWHRLLAAFRELTGTEALLQTPLASGDNPTVFAPRAVIQAFLATDFDYLALGDFLIENPRRAELLTRTVEVSLSAS
jgi:predicted NodU family carbamoyl transferase